MKKIVIINGHPNPSSFNFAIAQSYLNGAIESKALVETITIAELQFNPNLKFGYTKRIELEPDLLESWEKIKRADHLVWIHPIWWGGLPAITKGFIDRLFLPGMAFQHRENSVWWDKLLKGKTAHIITTLDQPSWYYRLFYARPSVNQLKKTVLEFCGIKPVKVSYIGIIKTADEKQREKWLKKVFDFGFRNK
ncbi:NAD(P)H-dependent oxidoreductase [[Flexibacter] sp. ATCC 35103]|uniref:NAD(P)H-dependent oxidoreductase n=1 Tax=[Flexibacter] sp. ATCC 35103 TaxID=1937528 RepID=UPI0009CFC84E|nr:NAD(P)H-dependent oxidoreductase [[Flexibacter] sp. ATCC 35103]OMQ11554.1 NADPH:quinone reductase [[Flexibacter] sp. ATCC 35103]